jgi:hypothetical protein
VSINRPAPRVAKTRFRLGGSTCRLILVCAYPSGVPMLTALFGRIRPKLKHRR